MSCVLPAIVALIEVLLNRKDFGHYYLPSSEQNGPCKKKTYEQIFDPETKEGIEKEDIQDAEDSKDMGDLFDAMPDGASHNC